MALIWAEGCDKLTTLAPLETTFTRVDATDVVINTTGGVWGGGAIEINDGPASNVFPLEIGVPRVLATEDLFVQFWFKPEEIVSADLVCFRSDGGISPICRVVTTDSGGLAYNSAGATTTTREFSDGGLFRPGKWAHVGVRLDPANSTGECQVWVNGTQVWNDVADMVGSSQNANITSVCFGGGNTTSQTYTFDDIIIYDATGSTFNSFLGPKRIYTLTPDGAGTTTNGTATGAASNWQAVDDSGDFDTTTYVEIGTTTNLDLYTTGALPETPDSIDGVEVVAMARTAGSTPRQGRVLARENVTTGNGTTYDINFGGDEGYFPLRHLFATNPDTASAWSGSEVDAMEIGWELVT